MCHLEANEIKKDKNQKYFIALKKGRNVSSAQDT